MLSKECFVEQVLIKEFTCWIDCVNFFFGGIDHNEWEVWVAVLIFIVILWYIYHLYNRWYYLFKGEISPTVEVQYLEHQYLDYNGFVGVITSPNHLFFKYFTFDILRFLNSDKTFTLDIVNTLISRIFKESSSSSRKKEVWLYLP